MNIKSIAALLVLVFFAASCSTMKVTSESDKSYRFDTMHTYQWIDGPAEILNEEDTYTNEDIKKALIHELANHNMRQVGNATEADVQIAYYVKLKEEHQYTDLAQREDGEISGGLVYSRESGSWKLAEREPDLNVYAVEIGTLTVLCYDAKTGQKVWCGTLKTKIDRSQPKERQQERIGIAATKLMDRFPVRAK
ncbi:MAG: DUF4136 domain-containing protein [Kiritimatiellales bacterium]|nr:DUF4136 domain-containing protein [Kiritimatiellales bacterium]MCF7864588.1 DUF4136 domain-containing protein [Kiritimatiellales bacterium]